MKAAPLLKKALFLPSYHGGGFGHIGRCLAVSEALQARGWQTAFALAGPHARRLGQSGQRVYHLKRPGGMGQQAGADPAFTIFSSMDYQLVRDGLFRPKAIRQCVAEQLGILRDFKPDVIVADTWPLAGILAHLAGLPLIQVTRSIVHPSGPGLLWWQEHPAGLVPPDLRPVFNPLLAAWGLPTMQRAEDLLAGDRCLIPGLPEIDPLPEGLEGVFYTGPLVRKQDLAQTAWLAGLDPNRPLVYVTTGGGAGSVGGLSFYRILMQALESSGWQAVISTGTRLSPQALPPPPPGVIIDAWVPNPVVIPRSSLVIFSGGYGTTMELVQAGTPGLVIPFHSEQESNGRRLETCGAARVLLPSQAEPIPVWHRWPGGRFSTLVRRELELTPGGLRGAIESALADKNLKEGARRLQARAAGYRGAAQAADFVEELVITRPIPEKNGWDRLNWWQKLGLQNI